MFTVLEIQKGSKQGSPCPKELAFMGGTASQNTHTVGSAAKKTEENNRASDRKGPSRAAFESITK